MSKLPISKNTEAKTVATLWSMGVESLNPDSYVDLERILGELCSTRNINNESIAIERKVLAGV